jgi:putative oxidoreductase
MSTVKAQHPLAMSPSGFQALLSRWNLARWAPIPLRLIVGYGFPAHGVAKLQKGPEHFVEILHAIGTPAPHFMAWLTILVELLGGLAVLSGAFVPWASAPMIAVLLVAIFTVHLPFGFTSIKLLAVTADGPKFGPPGYETDLLYLACLATLLLAGSGPLAVDNWIATRFRRKSQNAALMPPLITSGTSLAMRGQDGAKGC